MVVLLTVGVITISLLAANSTNAGHHNFVSSFLQFGAVNVSLQASYVVGVIILFSMRAFNAAAHSPTEPADNSEAFSRVTNVDFAARTGAPSLGSGTCAESSWTTAKDARFAEAKPHS